MLTQQVQSGDIDLILTVSPKPVEKLKTVKVYADDFAFFISPNYKKIKRKTVTLQDLAEHPILTDNHAHLAQDRSVLRAMSSLGLYSSSFFQLNSFEASIRLADKALGIALLPIKIAQNLRPRFEMLKLTVKDIPKDHFRHHVCATYLESSSLAENMCQFIRKQLTK